MADLKYYDIILRPVVTEESMTAMAQKKYTFYVSPEANKVMIKEAVEKMFDGVKVEKVYTMNLQGKKCMKFSDYVLKVLNAVCNVYITVIRGTPVVIQLMIMYYVILASSRNGIYAAFISFGMNSGAYVAEIVRSGIMSIDKGQFEASRSLGFNYSSTMIHVILPQAFKNILPALGNEFIVLVKETSVAGYVALQDLTFVGNFIRSRTYEAFFPLITIAIIYLIIVLILQFFLKKLERRLRNSDH